MMKYLLTFNESLHSSLQLQVPTLESFDDRWKLRTKKRMLRNLNKGLTSVYQYMHLIFGSSSYQPSLPSDYTVHLAGRLFQVGCQCDLLHDCRLQDCPNSVGLRKSTDLAGSGSPD